MEYKVLRIDIESVKKLNTKCSEFVYSQNNYDYRRASNLAKVYNKNIDVCQSNIVYIICDVKQLNKKVNTIWLETSIKNCIDWGIKIIIRKGSI